MVTRPYNYQSADAKSFYGKVRPGNLSGLRGLRGLAGIGAANTNVSNFDIFGASIITDPFTNYVDAVEADNAFLNRAVLSGQTTDSNLLMKASPTANALNMPDFSKVFSGVNMNLVLAILGIGGFLLLMPSSRRR